MPPQAKKFSLLGGKSSKIKKKCKDIGPTHIVRARSGLFQGYRDTFAILGFFADSFNMIILEMF